MVRPRDLSSSRSKTETAARLTSGLELSSHGELGDLDVLILAVAHRAYLEDAKATLLSRLRPGGVLVDVKGAIDPAVVPAGVRHWSL